jgi:glycerol kinase
MRVDGGASAMDLLCQVQADLLSVPVRRAAVQETTALGAAYLAGIAEGVWATPKEAAAAWRADAEFTPALGEGERSARRAQWSRAVERSRSWATE